MAKTFIRYNDTGKYYEYDTSAAKDGSGPWLILPIDGSQISQGDITLAAGNKLTTAAGNDLNLVAPAGRSTKIKTAAAVSLEVDNAGNLIVIGGGSLTTTAGNDTVVNAPTGRSVLFKIAGTTQVQVDAVGDIESEPWTDYSATSTIVGWTTFTTKKIYYKRVGKLVVGYVSILGTSNATTTTFTLPPIPATVDNSFLQVVPITQDNTVSVGPGLLQCAGISSGVITLFKNNSLASTWTNSGTKQVVATFWYEI